MASHFGDFLLSFKLVNVQNAYVPNMIQNQRQEIHHCLNLHINLIWNDMMMFYKALFGFMTFHLVYSKMFSTRVFLFYKYFMSS